MRLPPALQTARFDRLTSKLRRHDDRLFRFALALLTRGEHFGATELDAPTKSINHTLTAMAYGFELCRRMNGASADPDTSFPGNDAKRAQANDHD